MKFDWFVIPFSFGLLFMLVFISIKFLLWIHALNKQERKLLANHIFSNKLFESLREIFFESLLHRKIFKINRMLGYMHMSLAFGWFLLIVLGNIEVKFYSEYSVNPPYVPIFLNFFEPVPTHHFFGRGFKFLMDLLLLFILSGVALAYFKRINSRIFGMKRSMQHNTLDRIAIISLWLIFPLRLLAESLSAAIYSNGSFLTNTLGNWLGALIPASYFEYPAWWAYSISLGCFFVALPFSRYMHIPTELLLIIMRNAGIRSEKINHPYVQVEINACSRCGICVGNCQLSLLNHHNQPSYYLRDIRYGHNLSSTAFDCLLCGRCNVVCPVGIHTKEIRLSNRIDNQIITNYDFIHLPDTRKKTKVEVLYFAGCMSHLTPGIKKAMIAILNHSGYSWKMIDEEATVCCGRPLKLAGQYQAAQDLVTKNKLLIENSGAKCLVTSCPICYQTFVNDYQLSLQIMHHTQFIAQLIESRRLQIHPSKNVVVYHDPCTLGRDMGIYDPPRKVLKHIAQLKENSYSHEKSFCCGGSIAHHLLSVEEKKILATDVIEKLNVLNTDTLVTACPLCKKTFSLNQQVEVKDIAELVASVLIDQKAKNLIKSENVMQHIINQ